MYQYNQKPGTRIADASMKLIEGLRESDYSVLVGRNNCGKSFLLKTLTQRWGANASYLGPARYQNFNLLEYFTPNRNRKDEKYRRFLNQWNQQEQNIDNSPVNLQQAIAEFSDRLRRACLHRARWPSASREGCRMSKRRPPGFRLRIGRRISSTGFCVG